MYPLTASSTIFWLLESGCAEKASTWMSLCIELLLLLAEEWEKKYVCECKWVCVCVEWMCECVCVCRMMTVKEKYGIVVFFLLLHSLKIVNFSRGCDLIMNTNSAASRTGWQEHSCGLPLQLGPPHLCLIGGSYGSTERQPLDTIISLPTAMEVTSFWLKWCLGIQFSGNVWIQQQSPTLQSTHELSLEKSWKSGK